MTTRTQSFITMLWQILLHFDDSIGTRQIVNIIKATHMRNARPLRIGSKS